jgi:hypothetical protein
MGTPLDPSRSGFVRTRWIGPLNMPMGGGEKEIP